MGRIEDSDKEDIFSIIEALIKNGEAINTKLDPYHLYPAINPARSYADYLNWTKSIQTAFKASNLDAYLPQDFFPGENLRLPGTSINLTDKEGHQKLMTFRREVSEILQRQISIIKDIAEKIRRGNKTLTIFINDSGHVWREPKERFHHQGNRNDKRFKLLRLLAQSDGRSVPTKRLVDKIKYSSLQVLSQEKKDVNALLKDSLELPEDVILSMRMKGYRINPLFDVRLITNFD